MTRADENKAYFSGKTLADKCLFIKNLGWLLSQTREGVKGCRLIHNSTDDELVEITYNHGEKELVNISLDSYVAIIKDVTKRL